MKRTIGWVLLIVLSPVLIPLAICVVLAWTAIVFFGWMLTDTKTEKEREDFWRF